MKLAKYVSFLVIVTGICISVFGIVEMSMLLLRFRELYSIKLFGSIGEQMTVKDGIEALSNLNIIMCGIVIMIIGIAMRIFSEDK
jgi:hypothetical protein